MRILLATDGSEYSAEAARQCEEFASNIVDAKVRVVTALDNFTPLAAEPFVTSAEFLENVNLQMRDKAEENIFEAERILKKNNADLEIETKILIGLPKKTIIKEAEEWNADLIVVGSHGYGFWGRNFLGSVSDAVVHHAPCSVLIAKKNDKS